MTLLHEKFENSYKKFSSPVHNNSNKKHAFTLRASIHGCYELPIATHKKPAFQSLRLHTFHSIRRKRSRGISFSRDSFEDDPDYQEIPEELILNLPSARV